MEELIKEFPECDFSFLKSDDDVSYRRITSLAEANDYVNDRVNRHGLDETMFVVYGIPRVSMRGNEKILGDDVLLLFVNSARVDKYEFVGVKCDEC